MGKHTIYKGLTKSQKRKADRIQALFEQLAKEGVEWVSIAPGDEGNIHFIRGSTLVSDLEESHLMSGQDPFYSIETRMNQICP